MASGRQLNVLEAKRRQKLYQWYRRQWRHAHPIADARRDDPKLLPPVITIEQVEDIDHEVVAFYKNHPVYGWK